MSIGPSKETIMFEACLDRRLANTFVSFGASLLPSGGSFSSLPGGAIMPSTDRMKPTLIAGSRSLLSITIYSGLRTLCRARHNVRLLVKGRDQPVRVRPHFVIRLVVVAYRSVTLTEKKHHEVTASRGIAVGLRRRERPGEG
jgi:hypothetical protein